MMINFAGINPIKALFLTAVLNGFLAPPLLFLILKVSNNREIMGARVNGVMLNMAGWVTAGGVIKAMAGADLLGALEAVISGKQFASNTLGDQHFHLDVSQVPEPSIPS